MDGHKAYQDRACYWVENGTWHTFGMDSNILFLQKSRIFMNTTNKNIGKWTLYTLSVGLAGVLIFTDAGRSTVDKSRQLQLPSEPLPRR